MIDLVSVNVGQPEIIGTRRGRPVMSSIRKHPVTTDTVFVGLTNIAGDAQADLRVHGGAHKAVYAYSTDHLSYWTDLMKPDAPYGPGALGENLSVAGVDESGVCIGDVWQWGSAVLQVCQPRYPCYKLGLATGKPAFVKRFLESGRSGWYLRVLQAGQATTTGPIVVRERDRAGISVREAALAVSQNFEPERQLEISAHPALAPRWAEMLRHLAITPA